MRGSKQRAPQCWSARSRALGLAPWVLGHGLRSSVRRACGRGKRRAYPRRADDSVRGHVRVRACTGNLKELVREVWVPEEESALDYRVRVLDIGAVCASLALELSDVPLLLQRVQRRRGPKHDHGAPPSRPTAALGPTTALSALRGFVVRFYQQSAVRDVSYKAAHLAYPGCPAAPHTRPAASARPGPGAACCSTGHGRRHPGPRAGRAGTLKRVLAGGRHSKARRRGG